MIKIFMTGDNHIGRKYERFPDAKERLVDSRITSIRRMAQAADTEGCDFFVVTGDLFNTNSGVARKSIKDVADALAQFSQTVLVLPGNHDYYTEDNKLWKKFQEEAQNTGSNILLLHKFEPCEIMAGDERVIFYPACCHDKHSAENSLGWIKSLIQEEGSLDSTAYHIGIAHGALKGLTPDMKEEYYLMSEQELRSLPIDAWLIGHTHIPYPADLKEGQDTMGYRIFNAGTHEQTDFHNNTEGNCFILSIGADKQVAARKYISGQVHFLDKEVCIDASDTSETALRKALESLRGTYAPSDTILRAKVIGSVSKEEYEGRKKIAAEVFRDFLDYEFEDAGLSERITKESIRAEFPEIGFASKFLEALLEDGQEAQMAYELVKQCR